MLTQLRRHRVRTEDWNAVVDLFHQHIVPAREALGFEVLGVWGDARDGTFGWVIGDEAPDGWEAVEQAYDASPDRDAVPRDPRDVPAEVDTKVLEPLRG